MYREAQDTRQDRRAFATLWRAFMQEEYDDGGDLLPSDHNVFQARALFQMYCQGVVQGIVVFALDGDTVVGVGMAGLQPYSEWGGFDVRQGLTGTLWGIYVLPEYRRRGISHDLLDYGQTHPKMKGIQGYWSTVRDNKAARANAQYRMAEGHRINLFGYSIEAQENE